MGNFDHYYQRLAAAFVRGKALAGAFKLPTVLATAQLGELSAEQLAQIIELGCNADLRLHKFKRTMGLRRVSRVLGILKGIAPEDLLDIGSGRGVFLWPLLDEFPELPVSCIDQEQHRIDDINAVHAGGIETVSAQVMDATALTFRRAAFDVVSFLEVLEHIQDAQAALNEAVRVARRFVLVSVPSKEDNNPEHVHLFDQKMLKRIFEDAGAKTVTFAFVLNHMVAVARVGT